MWGSRKVSRTTELPKLASQEEALRCGEERSRLKPTRKRGVCAAVRRRVGGCDQCAGDTTKPHTLPQL